MNHSKRLSVVLLFVVCVVGMSECFGKQEGATPLYGASFKSTILEDGYDLIFPSLIRAKDHFENPIAEFYLYSSPHGGADIRLYVAQSVDGPWRLHKTVVNAEIGRAEHVSSPHAIWNEEAGELFLYVHAPNAQTIFCRSKNGIDFEYGGVCVTREMISEKIDFKSRSASYARVFAYPIAEYNSQWTMTLTASGGDKSKGINRSAVVLCTSNDGIEWTVRRSIIDDGDGGRGHKSMDGCWIPIDGRNFMVYALRSQAESKGNRTEPIRLHFSEGDNNWRNWKYRGVFYEPKSNYPDNSAARGFSWLANGKEPFLLYEAGQNRRARIATLSLEGGKLTPN